MKKVLLTIMTIISLTSIGFSYADFHQVSGSVSDFPVEEFNLAM